ncbi:hypothetical protein BFJ69_g17162 [Fusarium oxysporum]|uniref:HTH CENPB-type domain-containing protein n=1 Tax=Fusarium oxysporum TaxID=5507 RepID=A0A420M917_FUSOX|nr:hypothetical protein BFJ69_g17162 [Fusarium oxysporum]
MGRPRMLIDVEEEAIVSFVIYKKKAGLPASKGEIEEAAITLRLRRSPDAKPVRKTWYSRFRDGHSELDTAFLKAKEQSRVAYEEAGVEDTKQWFQQLAEVITKLKAGASECWNAGQAGVRVEILRERVQYLISDSAFSNGDITLEWAKHFNRHSWEESATVQHRQLDFEEWFGCNEHLKKSNNPFRQYDEPPNKHEEKDLVWRLLVIDGFSGHGGFAFREYCIKFNILVAFLLPHSTHILQSMDLGVFQPMENVHQKKLREALRKGNLTFNRRDFAEAFQEIFNEGFTAAHIISGFEKLGLFPPTARRAVTYLLMKQLKSKQLVDPAYNSLLPPETRFSAASDTARHVGERYHGIFSSPTRQGLRHIRNIVNKAILPEDVITKYVDDRRTRVEKRHNQRKLGKRAKPVGDYIHNVCLQELRNQQEEFITEGREKDRKSQIRSTRSIILREIESLKEE